MSTLRFPKGPTRDETKATARRHRADIVRDVRLRVMQRDSSCRVCGRTDSAEMHELTPRSLLRGLPPEQVFTTQNCLRLCTRCHARVTRHELTLLPADITRGADGRVEVQRVFNWRSDARNPITSTR